MRELNPNEEARLAHWNMNASAYEVITSDLHTLPLAIVQASSFNDMVVQLRDWSCEGVLCEQSVATLRNMVEHALPPNEGLLGTCVTEQFTLLELSGMRVHVQIS